MTIQKRKGSSLSLYSGTGEKRRSFGQESLFSSCHRVRRYVEIVNAMRQSVCSASVHILV